MKKTLKVISVVCLIAVLLTPTSVFAIDNREPNDSFETAQPAQLNFDSSYISSASDQDYFKITARNLIFTSVTSPKGKQYDLYLYDKDYNLLGSTLNPTIGTSIVKSTVPGQIYYLRVVSRDGSYDATNPYKLYVYFKFPFF